jgi:FAD-linked sulfhydryl oxidase
MAPGPLDQPETEQADAKPLPKLSKGVVLGPDGKP